jgi:hypothetical protein
LTVQKEAQTTVAFRKLTLEKQLKGVNAALKNRRTPKQLKEGLKKRAKQLRKQIDKKWWDLFEE